MLLAVSSLAFVSCEDDFDYYSNTNGNTNGNGQGTGGNGGTGGTGGSSCYLTKVFTDGELTQEWFYNVDYSELQSVKMFSMGNETTINYFWNAGSGLLDSAITITEMTGIFFEGHISYEYDNQGRVVKYINTDDNFGMTTTRISNVVWDNAQACGAVQINGTSQGVGGSSTFTDDYTYLDVNCSFERKFYQDGELVTALTYNFSDNDMPANSIEPPNEKAVFIGAGKELESIETVMYQNGSVSTEVLLEMEYTYDSEGKVIQSTNTNTIDGESQSFTVTYEYHCE